MKDFRSTFSSQGTSLTADSFLGSLVSSLYKLSLVFLSLFSKTSGTPARIMQNNNIFLGMCSVPFLKIQDFLKFFRNSQEFVIIYSFCNCINSSGGLALFLNWRLLISSLLALPVSHPYFYDNFPLFCQTPHFIDYATASHSPHTTWNRLIANHIHWAKM